MLFLSAFLIPRTYTIIAPFIAIWLKDIEKDFGAMNEVWNGYIDSHNKPVRATTEASLATPKLLVEIQVTAALD